MSQEERHGNRDLTYSAWHRWKSIARYIGAPAAKQLSMIDLDACVYVNYEPSGRWPLALIETAIDTGQTTKTATVTRNMARICRYEVSAWTMLYKKSDSPNLADESQSDIVSFRVQRIWPDTADGWTVYTPLQWAMKLVDIRAEAMIHLQHYLKGIKE